jgi:DNA repair exonuclease SbcCD ATPase subunit
MEENDQLQPHSDWDEYHEQELLSPTKVYEMLMAQQQQLQEVSMVLLSVMEALKQKASPAPDYQPYFRQMESRLQTMNNQYQSIQKLLENQGENIKSIDQLGNNLQEIKKTLNTQSKTLQDFLGWRMIVQITFVIGLSGLSLLIGSYFLNISSNSALEKKLDQINIRSEQIWKKIKK